MGQLVKNVLRSEKKTFSMNYQYINQHNQSTVQTATAISNMFVNQNVRQSEERNKTHAHNGCGCGKDLCLFPWGIMAHTTH